MMKRSRVDIEGMYIRITKAKKIRPPVKNWEGFLWDQEQDKDVHFCPLFNTVLQVLAPAIRQKEKQNPGQNGGHKTLFADHTILYIENPKDSTDKWIQ